MKYVIADIKQELSEDLDMVYFKFSTNCIKHCIFGTDVNHIVNYCNEIKDATHFPLIGARMIVKFLKPFKGRKIIIIPSPYYNIFYKILNKLKSKSSNNGDSYL